MASKKIKGIFPIEIDSEILSRLPVKTLLRCKSVQKSWYSLISDPHFIELHRRQCPKNNLFLVESHQPGYGNTIVVADNFSNELSVFEEPYPYVFNVVDSGNGLVCVHGQSYHNNRYNECFILWNPALRLNKIICDRILNVHYHDVNLCVGFGYHEKFNDYRVVRFTNDIKNCTIFGFEMYSLSSNSWEKIEVEGAVDSSRKYTGSDRFGVYINDAVSVPDFYGAYCWLIQTSDLDGVDFKAIILSFDMGGKVFREIAFPPIERENDTFINDYKLFNSRNSLAVLRIRNNYSYLSKSCSVWMMKEYGDAKSWTKLYKFELHALFEVKFLGITLDTELLLRTRYWGDDEVNASNEGGMKVLDIDKLKMNASSTKDVSILKRANRVSSFTENLMFLDEKKELTATRNLGSLIILLPYQVGQNVFQP